MVLIVPNEIDGLKQIEEKLVRFDLNKLTENTQSAEVNLHMPKFKLEESLQLVEPLKKVFGENKFVVFKFRMESINFSSPY